MIPQPLPHATKGSLYCTAERVKGARSTRHPRQVPSQPHTMSSIWKMAGHGESKKWSKSFTIRIPQVQCVFSVTSVLSCTPVKDIQWRQDSSVGKGAWHTSLSWIPRTHGKVQLYKFDLWPPYVACTSYTGNNKISLKSMQYSDMNMWLFYLLPGYRFLSKSILQQEKNKNPGTMIRTAISHFKCRLLQSVMGIQKRKKKKNK